MFSISYTNGQPRNTGLTAQEALSSVLTQWPGATILQERYQVDILSAGDLNALDGRALVWETPEDSINDDGGSAVAEIIRE